MKHMMMLIRQSEFTSTFQEEDAVYVVNKLTGLN